MGRIAGAAGRPVRRRRNPHRSRPLRADRRGTATAYDLSMTVLQYSRVPEPGTLGLLGVGLLVLCLRGRALTRRE